MIKKIPAFCAMFVLLFGLFLLSLLLPKQTYSESENKYLASMPGFSLSSFWNGSFEDKYSTYLSDQFPGRSLWISAKSVAESFLLKTENNGIVYGKDGYLFPKFQSYDEETYWDNLKAISSFAETAEAPVYVLVVPSAYTVLTDYFPAKVPAIDEWKTLREGLPLISNCVFVETWGCLNDSQHDYIYYRTDHHWTTRGAYLAYEQFCWCAGLEPCPYDEEKASTANGFYGTSFSKCKKIGTLPDTITFFPFDATLTVGETTYSGIYDFTKLQTRDKYAMFLYGNHAQSIVESSETAGKKRSLLIIKDSYADSVIPFLTSNYESITCIDPRYYLGSIQELASGDYDDILILLGFENLADEANWVKLSF